MGKSPLQIRAEEASAAFRASNRPALVVEFAGVPKAGKTSTLNQVYAFLRRCGFRCEVVVERASVCPIRDKKHFNFNVWTACTSLSQLLEKTQSPPRGDDPEILFLDRGIFDSVCWLSLLESLGRITYKDRTETTNFLLIPDWTNRISGVVAMSTSPEDALLREQGHLPVEGPGGSIMNHTVLSSMGKVIKDKSDELKGIFNIFAVDTSSKEFSGSHQATCEAVASRILDWVDESVEENILSADRALFPMLSSRCIANVDKAIEMIAKFEECGTFEPRRSVEGNLAKIQPLPVVVVRNQSGDVLRLIRKEKEETNKLHKKITVWAGGHVRREDSPNGSSAIVNGALRELQEELRIYATIDKLRLLGAIYIPDAKTSTGKHVAFVYEWKADSDDVQVALCNSEFMEKGGTSLQGVFLPATSVAQDRADLEEWSAEILEKMLD